MAESGPARCLSDLPQHPYCKISPLQYGRNLISGTRFDRESLPRREHRSLSGRIVSAETDRAALDLRLRAEQRPAQVPHGAAADYPGNYQMPRCPAPQRPGNGCASPMLVCWSPREHLL